MVVISELECAEMFCSTETDDFPSDDELDVLVLFVYVEVYVYEIALLISGILIPYSKRKTKI